MKTIWFISPPERLGRKSAPSRHNRRKARREGLFGLNRTQQVNNSRSIMRTKLTVRGSGRTMFSILTKHRVTSARRPAVLHRRKDIGREDRLVVIFFVRFIAGRDDRTFQRNAGKNSLVSAVSIYRRLWRHAGLRGTSDGTDCGA